MQIDVPNAKQQDRVTSKTVHVIIDSKPEINTCISTIKGNRNWNPTSFHHITRHEKRIAGFEPQQNWLTNTSLKCFLID